MTSIKLIVHGAKASAEVQGVLTAGMVGIPVTIEFDESWNGLSKNLVCRGGLGYEKFKGVSRTILGVGTTAKVAPEVMIAGEVLYLGVEGYNVDGTLVIPTTWACCGTIQEGVKTEGGPSEDPTLPIWEQLQARIDQFPGTIHEAIEEALKTGEFQVKDGNGIQSAVLNSDYTLTLKFDDGTSYTTPSIRGENGKDYVLTEGDKTEIAGKAAELVDLTEVFENSDYSKLCILDITNGWSSIGMTYEEIQAAHRNGKILVLLNAGYVLELVSADNGFLFERYYIEGTKLVTDRCTLEEDMIFHVPRVSVIGISGGSGGAITDEQIESVVDDYMADKVGGNNFYYVDESLEYQPGGIYFNSIASSSLSDEGRGVKVGDFIISSNNVLCKVTSIYNGQVSYSQFARIGGPADEHINNLINTALGVIENGTY